MNHIFRSIWSDAIGTFIAVAEIVSTGGKGPGKRNRLLLLAISLLLTLTICSGFASAADLPSGGNIVAGSGNISQSGDTLTINQDSQRLAADWTSFSIGQNHTVNFVQPSSSAAALNRVTGADASVIQGALNANGQVFLVNPNGVLFSPTAQVNVGALVASTLNVSNDDFMAGNYSFAGTSTNAIINQGSLNASNGGTIALIAARIINQGNIEAPQGNVLFGAGHKVTLDLGGPVKIEVEQALLDTYIEQGGAIKADGGIVYLTAKAASELASSVINHTGISEAQTLATGETGEIYLMGDMAHGETIVAGSLDASAPNGGDGGFIETSAAKVTFADNVNITTKAAYGQTGNWLIDPFDFTVAASGGDITGSALAGLLGSNNIQIETADSPTATPTNLIGSSGTNGDIFVNDAVTWNAATTLTLNAFRNIEINADITAQDASGKLALEYGQGAVAAGNTATYSLGAGAQVNLQAGQNFDTKLGSDGATVNYTVITALGAEGSVTSTDLQGMNGTLSGKYALGADIDASATSGWDSAAGWTPIGNDTTAFTGTIDGLGHSIDGLTIDRSTDNDQGLFGVTDGATIRNIGLTNVDFTGREGVGGLVGASENSTISDSYYASGAVTGVNTVGGLVGGTMASTISNSYASGAVTGVYAVGGLVGVAMASTISNSYASGAVTGTGEDGGVGGLVGVNVSTISNSYASGKVTGTKYVGGLVGLNSSIFAPSTISNSYASGAVTGTDYVGGLVGGNGTGTDSGFTGDTISDSYASGLITVTGDGDKFGGLVGYNDDDSVLSGSFWDIQNSGIGESGDDNFGATGKTTAEMMQLATFTDENADWSIDAEGGTESIWRIYEGSTSPLLRSFLTPITVTAYDQSKVYGNDDPTLSYQVTTGNLAGDDALAGNLSRTAGENVGSYTISADALNNSNYDISVVDGDMTITARPITVTADGKSKVYGNDDPTLSYQVTTGNLVGADALAGELTRTAGENVGSYTISADALTNDNYDISVVDGQLTITARPITVTADGKSKVYGNDDPTLSYQVTTGNLVGADALAGELTRTAGENVGSYTISANALANDNYDISVVDGQLTITARPITVTADGKSKVYGNDDPTLSYQVTTGNLVGADGLAGELTRTAGENVGSYTISADALTNDNYDISVVDGQLTITARPITVTADGKNKVYGNDDPTLSYQVTAGNLVGADALAGELTRTAGENVGSYTISADALANNNYDISVVDGQLTITARPITVTADGKSKVYGNDDPTLSYQVTTGNLVGADALAGELTRTDGESVGSYTISADALANDNYDISVVDGQLTITARPITVTADGKSKIEGQIDPALTYQAEAMNGDRGLVTGESLAGSLNRIAGESVASYEIQQGTVTNVENPNYEVAYVAANMTISPEPTPAAGSDEQQMQNVITYAQQTATPSNGVGTGMAPGPFTAPLTALPQTGGSVTPQGDASSRGGLVFVNVSADQGGARGSDDSENKSAARRAGVVPAGSISGGGQDSSGFVHVFVVNGGINLSGTGLKAEAGDDNSNATVPQIN